MAPKIVFLLLFIRSVIGQTETYIGCERERIVFRCGDGMAPDIDSAIWGRQDGASCPIPANDIMSCSADVTDLVRAKCQLVKCAFSPNKRYLGEPCDGDEKLIIKIIYTCRPEITTTTTEPTTTTTATPTTTTTPAPPTGCDFGPITCHCEDGAPCDETGSCANGCDDGTLENQPLFYSGIWSGPGCRIGNVAYGKTATQYGTWAGLDADNALDGLKGETQWVASNPLEQCAHPHAPSGENTWWKVDLAGPHVIFSVTILQRDHTDYLKRIWNTEIGVGDSDDITSHARCATIEQDDPDMDTSTFVITKTCLSPLVGRYVCLRRTGGIQPHEMNFCEVYVNGFQLCTE